MFKPTTKKMQLVNFIGYVYPYKFELAALYTECGLMCKNSLIIAQTKDKLCFI